MKPDLETRRVKHPNMHPNRGRAPGHKDQLEFRDKLREENRNLGQREQEEDLLDPNLEKALDQTAEAEKSTDKSRMQQLSEGE